MYKIVIVTTEGCEACNIAEDNITAAVAQSSVDVDIEDQQQHSPECIAEGFFDLDLFHVSYLAYLF